MDVSGDRFPAFAQFHVQGCDCFVKKHQISLELLCQHADVTSRASIFLKKNMFTFSDEILNVL